MRVLHPPILPLVKPYEKMNLKQLNEAEDEFDEEDRKAVEMYRYAKLLITTLKANTE